MLSRFQTEVRRIDLFNGTDFFEGQQEGVYTKLRMGIGLARCLLSPDLLVPLFSRLLKRGVAGLVEAAFRRACR